MTAQHKASYGTSVKHKPDLTRCCEEVTVYTNGWPRSHQCNNKAKTGPDNAYCAVHSPEKVKERQAASDAKSAADFRKRRLEWNGPRFYQALVDIANGHNDARGLAKSIVDGFEELS